MSCGCSFIGGMFRSTPHAANKSAIVKPRSAITESPGSNKSKIPLCMVSSLSDTQPPNILLTKQTSPDGVIPTNGFKCVVILVAAKS